MLLTRNGFGVWSLVSKRAFKAIFNSPSLEVIENFKKKGFSDLKEIAIYIHFPFCHSICLFCPYVRYPLTKFGNEIFSKYIEALNSEMEIYGSMLRELGLKVKVADVHIGGGTPSLLEAENFQSLRESIRQSFDAEVSLAIEANPDDLADQEKAFKLADAGVNEVSLGVQSFNPEALRKLGRVHGVTQSVQAIQNLKDSGIGHINIDLMYMIPSKIGQPLQSLKEWEEDLSQASEQPVDEITCYPTLITNYSLGWKLVSRGEISQPSKKVFKQMVYMAEDYLTSKGFIPLEIYGYSKHSDWKYVTVNYEMEGSLLGLGCGAAGFVNGYEYQNTCFVPDYIECVREKKLPIAGIREVDKLEHAIRFAVCELFVCRSLSFDVFKRKFGLEFHELIGKSGFGRFLKMLKLLGKIKEKPEGLELTREGLFTAQQICWSFVLNVPCRISEEFMKEVCPSKVAIP
ncbi:MAG: hypothetical protein DRO43_06715 [Candidatus Hecatellales archaeon]|nr:MAG: hypothetical protein DRO43_06715 [Candidatus Hecatellales archaeon]